jgi:AraC-like DNA-binding protein
MEYLASKLITIYQALQLVGLTPSLFIIIFLCFTLFKNRQALIPILYFLALSCSFALPLVDLVEGLSSNVWIMSGLMFGESVLTSCCFLLIMQFLLGRIPPFPYWLVFAVPLVGGSALIYLNVSAAGHECMLAEDCPNLPMLRTLYNMFSSSLLFLLLTYYASRRKLQSGDDETKHRYWLIIALILVHLALLGLDLNQLLHKISPEQNALASTIIRLSFIYLVLTSLFRVFYPNFVQETLRGGVVGTEPRFNLASDQPHINTIKRLLEQEFVYREMRLNRAALARKVGIGENYLSRLINHYFDKSFHELINGYRINEAKKRLMQEKETAITTIAFEVGFNSIASFNRVFKELAGVSPSEYRGSEGRNPEEAL